MKTLFILSFCLLFASVSVKADNIGDRNGNLWFNSYNNDASSMIKMHKALLNDDEKPIAKQSKADENKTENPTPVDPDENARIRVFPNPCIFSVKIMGASEGDQIFVTNAVGQIVLNLRADQENPTLDVSNLAPGLYILGIQKESETIVLEFMK